MADNTPTTSGDVIATDDLTTLNGGAVSGVKAQRVKVGFGSDGSFRDVDLSNGLPIVGVQDARTTGTITSAASVVGPVAISNRNVVTIDISGTYAGVTFVAEASPDGGTTYYPVQGVNNGTGQAGSTWTPGTNASATFDFAVGGFTQFRVRATAWTSGTANVGISMQTFAYDPAIATIAQGTTAPGSAVVGNPVLVGGTDGTNARTLLLGATGLVFANISQWGAGNVTAAAAAADAAANPTVPQVGAAAELFNGTTWDRARGTVNTTTGDTGTKTASFAGATQTNFNHRGAFIYILCGTVSGTTPTLAAQLQWSPDGGTTWVNVGTANTALTATGNSALFIVGPTNHSQAAGNSPAVLTSGATQTVALNFTLPRTWRLNYTIGGTTPSFAITNVFVNYTL